MTAAQMSSLVAFALQALAAAALVLASCLASYAISSALIPRRPTLLRWIGTVVIGLWTANAAFHLLAALRAFTLPAALGGVALLILILSRSRLVAESRESLARDRRVVRWLMQRRIPAPRLWMVGCFSLFGALLMIRTLVVPPLSWDTLTYHAVKSALWVQNAGELPLRTPGGWSAYRNYFGGGEILWAWAMLPFGADTLAPLVDAVEWLALGLAMVALARELGVREPIASAQAGFVLMVPTFQLVLGSGYVELALNLAFVSGMAFAIRFMRRPAPSKVEGPAPSRVEDRPVWLAFAFAGLGVAGGVKVTALPLLGVMFAALTLRAALSRDGMRRYAGEFLVGTAAIAMMTLPWIANNVRESGYPLSPMPINVAGVTLGEPNEVISWYDQRPNLKSTRQSEMFVLEQIFRLPPERNENLGALAGDSPDSVAPRNCRNCEIVQTDGAGTFGPRARHARRLLFPGISDGPPRLVGERFEVSHAPGMPRSAAERCVVPVRTARGSCVPRLSERRDRVSCAADGHDRLGSARRARRHHGVRHRDVNGCDGLDRPVSTSSGTGPARPGRPHRRRVTPGREYMA